MHISDESSPGIKMTNELKSQSNVAPMSLAP